MFKIRYLVIFILMWSCKPGSQDSGFTTDEEDVEVVITHTSGDEYGDLPYIPLIGNLGKTSEESKFEVLILGSKMEKGVTDFITPFAVMNYYDDNVQKQLIVATPTNPVLKTIDVDDLVDFSVSYGSIKRIIEQWYASFKGLGKNRIVGWDNKTTALDVLLSESPVQ